MVIHRQRLSVMEFDALILTPQYADRHLEYIAGKMVDVVSSGRPSQIAGFSLPIKEIFADQVDK
jgi:hypothetical protein